MSTLPIAQELVNDLRRDRCARMATVVFVDELGQLFTGDATRPVVEYVL